MKKAFKRILFASASLLMLASVGDGLAPSHTASASHYRFSMTGNGNPVERIFGKKGWTSGPLWAFHSFNYHGHHFTMVGHHNFTGDVTSLDGNYHATNAQIDRALRGKNPYRRTVRRHRHRSRRVRRHRSRRTRRRSVKRRRSRSHAKRHARNYHHRRVHHYPRW